MMVSILDYLKEYAGPIVGVITVAFTLFGFHTLYTFLTANSFERQFFSKESKILYSIITYSFVFIFAPSLLAYINFYNNPALFSFFNNYIFIILILYFVILGLLLIIKVISLNKVKLYLIKQNLKFFVYITNEKFRFFVISILLLSIWILIGTTNYYVLNQITTTNAIVVLIIFYSFEIYIVFLSVSLLRKFNLTEPILVTIKMDNGDLFEYFFIYNISKHNFIQIGKDKDPLVCKEPLLIPISKIAYCKRVNYR